MPWVQIATATMSGNSRASVHQAAKLVAAFLMVARVTAGLAESNDSYTAGFMTHVTCTLISSGTLRSAVEHGLPLPFSSFLLF